MYNTLVDFIRGEYRKRGYQEVVSPNIYNSKLWVTSGHWAHYAVRRAFGFGDPVPTEYGPVGEYVPV